MAIPQGEESAKSAVVQDLTGTTVGRFAIRARLGAGGMGEVYRAEDTTLKRPVAIKRVIPSSGSGADYRRRILKEAERASRLSDRRIAQIYDVIEEKSEIYLVMEYVEGETLRQRFQRPMKLSEFLSVAIECAQALESAHQRNIIHCDIKPDNIMLTAAGEVKVLDFGIAKEITTSDSATATFGATQAGMIRGTPAYMAPEVLLEGEPDARSDIFSLGVVFYEALSGTNPFRAPTFMATSDNVLHRTPPSIKEINPRIPPELSRIVARMLAKIPEARYPTAARVLEDLRNAQQGVAPSALIPVRALQDRPARAWRRPALAGAAIALALIIAAAAVLLMRRNVSPPAPANGIPAQAQLAVLPFTSFGGGPETDAFSRGLAEILAAKLTELSAGHSLQVVPAGDVLSLHVTTAEQARKQFGVSLVLEGSLQRSGDLMRITYSLADPASHRQLRAATITAAANDSFGIEDTVVDGAAGMLGLAVEQADGQQAGRHGTQVAEAFTSYLQGRGYLQEYHREENINRAIGAFQEALKLDPSFAQASASLGDAYWKRYALTRDTRWTDRAQQACNQAVMLNAKLAASHLCLGELDNGTGQFAQAVVEYQRAIAADRNSEEAFHGLADAYHGLGKLAETEKTFQQAVLLRPNYWAPYNWLGDFYANTGEYEKAAAMFKQVTALAPENPRGYANLGAMNFRLHRWDEAERMFKRSVALDANGTAYSNLGTLYYYEGRFTEAARQFEQAVQLVPKYEMWWANLGDAYRWAPGERAKAPAAYNMAVALAEEQLRLNPRSAETLSQLALCQAKLGHLTDALRAIRAAARLAPGNPEYVYYQALVFHLAGERAQSLDQLKKAVSMGYPVSEIRAEPEWRDLSNDAEFRAIIENKTQKEG